MKRISLLLSISKLLSVLEVSLADVGERKCLLLASPSSRGPVSGSFQHVYVKGTREDLNVYFGDPLTHERPTDFYLRVFEVDLYSTDIKCRRS